MAPFPKSKNAGCPVFKGSGSFVPLISVGHLEQVGRTNWAKDPTMNGSDGPNCSHRIMAQLSTVGRHNCQIQQDSIFPDLLLNCNPDSRNLHEKKTACSPERGQAVCLYSHFHYAIFRNNQAFPKDIASLCPGRTITYETDQCIYRIRTDSGFVLYAFDLPIVISIRQPAETRFSSVMLPVSSSRYMGCTSPC